jgi:predicted metal-dependent hydrolase
MILSPKIVRSRRKSIAVEIDENAELIVRAPNWVSQKFINTFLKEKEAWIQKHLMSALVRQKAKPTREYKEGETFFYLGEPYTLSIIDSPQYRLFLADQRFVLSPFYANQARQEFEKWYKKQALKVLQERVDFYATQHQFSYASIRLNQARRQWGSCAPDNRLSFTWRLIMAPLFVIDSVVVHELVHTKVKNHSAKFWQEVYRIFPAYEKASRWMNENAHFLAL